MTDRNKGKRLDAFINDYVVIDIETTSQYVNSAKIIELAAVKIRDNVVVDEFKTLINPEISISKEITGLTGIDNNMVKDAPCLKDAIDDFLCFVSGDVLVGHNISTFDLNVLYDKILKLRGIELNNNYVDTLYLSRKCVDDIQNHRLVTLCDYFDIINNNAHRALNDCYVTKQVYDKLKGEFEQHGFIDSSKSVSTKHKTKFTEETKALQLLHGFLMGIVADDKLTTEEIMSLNKWMNDNIQLKGNYPFDRVYKALGYVLEDGVIEANELNDLLVMFKHFISPTEEEIVVKIDCILDKHICLTGEFKFGSRDSVKEFIENKGAIYDNAVKKTTDYVVVGSLGSENWKQGVYGSKIKKAKEWQDKGVSIEILSEEEFFKQLESCAKSTEIENVDTIDDDQQVLMMVNLDDKNQWHEKIQNMLSELTVSLELPTNSLYIAANVGRVTNKITSYSVCIYEPEYPMIPNQKIDIVRNSVIMAIKETDDKLTLLINALQFEAVPFDTNLETKILKSAPKIVNVVFNKDSDKLVDFIKLHAIYRVNNYTSKASTFSCCSRFNDCSDAKKCVHENKLYSKACSYRRHLDSGRIFYGKNRNID